MEIPETPHLRPQSDYMYERRGPWPQPQPEHPFGFAPGVVHLPKNEIRKWFWQVGLRYDVTLVTYWPVAAWYAFTHRSLLPVSDDAFEEAITHSALSKFISNELNEREKYPDNEKLKIFAEFLNAEPNEKFFVADYSLLRHCKTYPGMYVAATMTLFKGDLVKGKRKVVAIYFYNEQKMFTPSDGNAWELAKYFVLQGGAIRITSSAHANLHFPYDSINAISKSSLPKDSVLLRLLLPHLDLTLELNYSVLNSSNSPIRNKQYMPYSAFPAPEYGLIGMFYYGYNGIEGNPSYPKFRYHLEAKQMYTDYGTFQMAYYDTIYDFVAKVVHRIPKDEYLDIYNWANYVKSWVPEFPPGTSLFEEDADGNWVLHHEKTLEKAIAKIIWDLSVGHASDHYDVSRIPPNIAPLRLRVPPPESKDIPPLNRRKLIDWMDTFKHVFITKMFIAPRNVYLLKDVQYNFYKKNEDELRKLSAEFLQNLRKTEKNLTVTNYIPLNQISRSIQY